MPRQGRLIFPDVAVHIVQRGHDRRDCFRQETDYLVYLANLRDVMGPSGCALHAYCLMTNHVHLLVTPSHARGCAVLMRDLGQRYVQYFNRRYERRGTLWEGRYHSCLVQSASYLIACYRYVERNPVRARMVPDAAAYPWSSYAGNGGHTSNKLLTPHAEYLALASTAELRQAAYRDLVAGVDDAAFLAAIRDATNGGFALVDEAFKARLPAVTQKRLTRRPPGPPAAVQAFEKDEISAELGLCPRIS
jgi:putative transposase